MDIIIAFLLALVIGLAGLTIVTKPHPQVEQPQHQHYRPACLYEASGMLLVLFAVVFVTYIIINIIHWELLRCGMMMI